MCSTIVIVLRNGSLHNCLKVKDYMWADHPKSLFVMIQVTYQCLLMHNNDPQPGI